MRLLEASTGESAIGVFYRSACEAEGESEAEARPCPSVLLFMCNLLDREVEVWISLNVGGGEAEAWVVQDVLEGRPLGQLAGPPLPLMVGETRVLRLAPRAPPSPPQPPSTSPPPPVLRAQVTPRSTPALQPRVSPPPPREVPMGKEGGAGRGSKGGSLLRGVDPGVMIALVGVVISMLAALAACWLLSIRRREKRTGAGPQRLVRVQTQEPDGSAVVSIEPGEGLTEV